MQRSLSFCRVNRYRSPNFTCPSDHRSPGHAGSGVKCMVLSVFSVNSVFLGLFPRVMNKSSGFFGTGTGFIKGRSVKLLSDINQSVGQKRFGTATLHDVYAKFHPLIQAK